MKTVSAYEISLVFEKSSRDTEPSPHCTAWLASNAPLSSLPLLPKLWITAVRYTQLRHTLKMQSREGFIRSLTIISPGIIRWIEVPSWKCKGMFTVSERTRPSPAVRIHLNTPVLLSLKISKDPSTDFQNASQ